jgi:3'(2'), 5'-bisphosphate nucleotidase
MFNLNIPEIKFALETVRQAALLVRSIQTELVTASITKEDRSPVTIADFASQALVAAMLEQSFPNDPLVAEEDSSTLRQPSSEQMLSTICSFLHPALPQTTPDRLCAWIDRGQDSADHRFWTLDPIDGTKGFLRGDQYAVALALLVDGKVQVGVLGCPRLDPSAQASDNGDGSLVIAVQGEGTWATSLRQPGNFTRLRASSQSDIRQARLLRSFESGHTNVSQIDTFVETLHIQAPPVRMDSQAKYALLAAGKGDILLRLLTPSKPDYREKIWDQAAGSLVIEEAGGRITDLRGHPLNFQTGRSLLDNRGILASNGVLHPLALQALKEISAVPAT